MNENNTPNVIPQMNNDLNIVNCTLQSGEEKPVFFNSKENIKRKLDIEDIINYLNEMCGTHYRTTTPSTIRHINARYNEGFTYEDFINVIINKTDEWLGTDMEKYLTPDTLFGTKFEKYLNQGGKKWKEKTLTKSTLN